MKTIQVNDNLELFIKKLEDLKIILNDDSSLLLNIFEIYHDKKSINIDIESYNSTTIELNYSYITSDEININVNYHVIGNDNKGNIVIKSISSDNGHSSVVINGIVDEKTKNNEMNESVRIITKNDLQNSIIPNMIINSLDVIANHSATIGKIDDNELNYLMGKGMSKKLAESLIESGFIQNNLKISKEEKKKITDYLINGR